MKPINLAAKIFGFLINDMGMNVKIKEVQSLSDKLIATDGEGARYEITIAFLGNVSHNETDHAIKANKLDFTQNICKNG